MDPVLSNSSERRCPGPCGRLLPPSEFHRATERRNKRTSRCKKCRSKYSIPCSSCQELRRLDKNGVCTPCNTEAALRHCRSCDEILPFPLAFNSNEHTCKWCRSKEKNKLREAADLRRAHRSNKALEGSIKRAEEIATKEQKRSDESLRLRARCQKLLPHCTVTKHRQNSWKYRYGLTLDGFLDLVEAQNGQCAICSTTSPGRGHQFFSVDHEHVEGFRSLPPAQKLLHIRGLLCHRCNVGLGMVRDSVEVVRSLIRYLESPTFDGFLLFETLTDVERDSIVKGQEGCCAACGIDIYDNPHIDHNHDSGEVRGALCVKCNWGLGYFNDSIDVLWRAHTYLMGRT